VALALLGLSVLAWSVISGARWHSPPTASRAHFHPAALRTVNWFEDGKESGLATVRQRPWNELQAESVRATYLQRPWERLQLVKADGHQVTLRGTPRSPADQEAVFTLPIQVHRADAHNSVTVPGGRLRLVAIAGAWPESLIGYEFEAPKVPAAYWGPLDGLAMNEAQFAGPLETMRPSASGCMHLRLLFEVEGDVPMEGVTLRIFDARTHAVVGARENWEAYDHVEVRQDRYVAIDLDTGVWHDTPLEVMLDLASGAEQRQAIGPATPQTFTFTGPGQRRIEVTRLLTRPETYFGRSPKLAGDTATFPVSHAPFMSLGLQFSAWDLGNVLDTDQLYLQSRSPGGSWPLKGLENVTTPDGPEMDLVYRPERLRCWFRIAGMPMAPNSREGTRDLLDVRIPGPVERLDYTWLAAIAQLEYEDPLEFNVLRPLIPAPRNRSVRELLQLHARMRGEQVAVDSKKLTLTVRDKGPLLRWLDAAREEWEKRWP